MTAAFGGGRVRFTMPRPLPPTLPLFPPASPAPAGLATSQPARPNPPAGATPPPWHPALWRATQLRQASGGQLPSGFATLDAELPGGGWPLRALTELLLPHWGLGELRLLAPALARLAAQGRCLMLFNPPALPHAPALASLGLPPAQCLVVQPGPRPAGASPRQRRASWQAELPGQAHDLCWALEQTLRSGQAGAVLAWLGRAARPEVLRRLQLAAQAHAGPVFLLREPEAQHSASPAPLRLSLASAGPDQLAVQVLKRRGPLHAQPLTLALPPVLSARALQRALAPRQPAPGPQAMPPVVHAAMPATTAA